MFAVSTKKPKAAVDTDALRAKLEALNKQKYDLEVELSELPEAAAAPGSCITVSLAHWLTVSLFYCITVSLAHWLTASLYHCITVLLAHVGLHTELIVCGCLIGCLCLCLSLILSVSLWLPVYLYTDFAGWVRITACLSTYLSIPSINLYDVHALTHSVTRMH